MEDTDNKVREEFDVIITGKPAGDMTVLTTSELTEQKLRAALDRFDPENKVYSAILGNESKSGEVLTVERIDEIAENAQNDLKSIMTLNSIVRKFVNTDDILGRVVEAITTNVNGDYTLSYNNFGEQRNKAKTLKRAKEIIDDFNKQIDLSNFIRNLIPTFYIEGNYILYLRNDNSNWVIDYYPLGIAEISDYSSNGNPVILINLKELENRLKKTFKKTKSGKALFFDAVVKEIESNYPAEVVAAFKAKENYVTLDYKRARAVRINNLSRKYGLSPAVKALKALMMLNTFAKSDEINAKARAKKIIVQLLNDKLLGTNGDKKALEDMAYVHDNFVRAFKQQTVLYTGSAAVRNILYVEPKTEDISVDKENIYRNKALTALGISFLAGDRSQTASTANIALNQLMKMINSMSEQVEKVLRDFYMVVLEENGIGPEYCPKIKIIDSELLDMEMKISLVSFLYAQMNASLDTCFNYLGIDLQDEKAKREQENADKLEEIFKPRITAFTSGGEETMDKDYEKTGGRPSDNDPNNPDKQIEDKEYNKTRE